MPVVTTNAIVLSSLKYSDTSLIVKCFTSKEGLKTYLIRGILKAKKRRVKGRLFSTFNTVKNCWKS